MTARRHILIALMVFTSSFAASADDVELCHIANAGFMASDGEKSIVIDGLFARGLVGYHFASHPLRREIEYGQGKFSNVRMIFASHYHDDHMKSEPILRHMRKNPDTAIIVSKQGLQKLLDVDLMPYEVERITSITPKVGTQHTLENMPFPTTLYGISHGAGRGIENIGIMVEVAGQTIMHVGDMDAQLADLKAAGIDKLKVNWLLMPYWHLMSETSVAFVTAAFDAEHIVPMHYDKGDLGDWIKSQGGIEAIKVKVRKVTPNLVELDTEMACVPLS